MTNPKFIREINDFQLYAKSNGVSSLNQHYAQSQIRSSLTPYVLEDNRIDAITIDIFSRMMMDKIIFLGGPVNDTMSLYTVAQLQFLDAKDNLDIKFQISSPGGEVDAGLAIIDVMEYINCDIETINIKMAASMGAMILGAGTKGKRYSLRSAKTMLHQTSGGTSGNIQDARIQAEQWEKTNLDLMERLAGYCDKDIETVTKDTERDNWLSAKEAVEYGIIDEVILKKAITKKK